MILALRRFALVCRGVRLAPFLLLVVAYGVAQGLSLLLVVPVFDAVLSADLAGAWTAASALLVAAGAATALFFLQARAGYRASLALVRRLQHRMGDHIADLPVGWFSRTRTGELSQLTSKNAEDAGSITAHLLQPVVSSIVSPLVVVIGLCWWDVRVALAGALFLPVSVVIGFLAPLLTARADREVDRRTVTVNEQVVDFALAQPLLRSSGRGVGDYPPLDAALDAQYRAHRRSLWLVLPGTVLNTLAVQLWLLLFLAVTLGAILGGALPLAAGIGLLVVAVRFVGPLAELSEYATALRGVGDSIARIDDLLGTAALPEPDEPRMIPRAGLPIDLDDVRFGYGDEDVLTGITCHLAPGTMTALVGPSGSGKTTLLRLIARFWDVSSGAVRIGGVDVRDLGTEQVMDRVAIVFQDVFLFDDSIFANVRAGRPEAGEAEVWEAIRRARVDEIARRLPDGVHTLVGEGGSRLSGGERQRVSIARALLKDAPIVLLDEATASVDPENEAALAAAFRELADGRTVLSIAHRLDTIKDADQILVLDEGGIVERGDHARLLEAAGRYAAFWHAKEDAAGWRIAGGATARG